MYLASPAFPSVVPRHLCPPSPGLCPRFLYTEQACIAAGSMHSTVMQHQLRACRHCTECTRINSFSPAPAPAAPLLVPTNSCIHNTTCIAGGGAQQTWRLEGAGGPHDIAVAAAPMPVRGTGDRALALFVAETKPSYSSLRKYLFVPTGKLSLPVPQPEDCSLSSLHASRHNFISWASNRLLLVT